MALILVVGATGQLGTAAIDRLVGMGHFVRALVRPGSPREFPANGVELAFGDLRDRDSLAVACRGVATVLATANVVVPRSAGGFAEVEGVGYAHLFDACKAEGVRRVVLMSTDVTPHDARVTTFRTKRQTPWFVGRLFRTGCFLIQLLAALANLNPRLSKSHAWHSNSDLGTNRSRIYKFKSGERDRRLRTG